MLLTKKTPGGVIATYQLNLKRVVSLAKHRTRKGEGNQQETAIVTANQSCCKTVSRIVIFFFLQQAGLPADFAQVCRRGVFCFEITTSNPYSKRVELI